MSRRTGTIIAVQTWLVQSDSLLGAVARVALAVVLAALAVAIVAALVVCAALVIGMVVRAAGLGALAGPR